MYAYDVVDLHKKDISPNTYSGILEVKSNDYCFAVIFKTDETDKGKIDVYLPTEETLLRVHTVEIAR